MAETLFGGKHQGICETTFDQCHAVLSSAFRDYLAFGLFLLSTNKCWSRIVTTLQAYCAPLSNQEAMKRRKRWLEEMKGRYASGEEDLHLATLMSSPAVARAFNSSRHGRHKRSSLFSYLGRYFTSVSCLLQILYDILACCRNMTWWNIERKEFIVSFRTLSGGGW